MPKTAPLVGSHNRGIAGTFRLNVMPEELIVFRRLYARAEPGHDCMGNNVDESVQMWINVDLPGKKGSAYARQCL